MSIVIKKVPLPTVWHMRKEVMYPELSVEETKLPDDESGEHIGLYDNDELCSIISLFNRDNELQFRKFATAVHLQGKGFGTALLTHVFERAKAQNKKAIWCNARTAAIPFYQKFGMQPYGETWEQHGRQFVKMRCLLSLAAVGEP